MTSKRHLGDGRESKDRISYKGSEGREGPAVWDFPETGSNFGQEGKERKRDYQMNYC